MVHFPSDRQIVERVIIPAMMSAIVTIMRTGLPEDCPYLNEASALLKEAMNEAVAGLPADRVSKIVRRAKRIAVDALKPNFDQPIGIQYLAVAYWTKELADTGAISIGANSAFSRAWDIMTEVMDTAWDGLQPNEHVAQQAAQRLASDFRAQGYFSYQVE